MPSRDEKFEATRAANPAESGPKFKIDRSDSGVIERLNALKERVKREAPAPRGSEAPEVLLNKVHVQLPPIVEALIAEGTLNVWEAARSASGYPYTGESFNDACELIAQIEGVEVIPPKAS